MKAILPIFVLIAGLSACAPKPEPLPQRDPSIDVTPGLNEREPDTCNTALYRYFVGKPVAGLKQASAGKPLNIITPASLGSQEYNSSRINAHTDAAGIVTHLTCG